MEDFDTNLFEFDKSSENLHSMEAVDDYEYKQMSKLLEESFQKPITRIPIAGPGGIIRYDAFNSMSTAEKAFEYIRKNAKTDAKCRKFLLMSNMLLDEIEKTIKPYGYTLLKKNQLKAICEYRENNHHDTKLGPKIIALIPTIIGCILSASAMATGAATYAALVPQAAGISITYLISKFVKSINVSNILEDSENLFKNRVVVYSKKPLGREKQIDNSKSITNITKGNFLRCIVVPTGEKPNSYNVREFSFVQIISFDKNKYI